MRKGRRWLWLLVAGLAGCAILTALFEPSATVRAFLAGEPFYRNRPLRYWREILREHGRQGRIPGATVARFTGGNAAFPVLRECARDPDPHVRWPAVSILGEIGRGTQPALDVLVESLDDSDPEVRLKAITALGLWGPMARQAIPALTARLSDPEFQVGHYADQALWRIDESAASAADGYHSFHSGEFGFSVMVPGEPEREDKPNPVGPGVIHSFQMWHRAGPNPTPTRYIALVVEYPPETLEGISEDERFQRQKNALPMFTGGKGKIVQEKTISLGERKGWEYVMEVEGLGNLRSRQFWIGSRLYSVMVAYNLKYLNGSAGDYFLDSFQLDEKIDAPGK